MNNKWHFLQNTFIVLLNKSQKRFYKFMYLFLQALYAHHSITEINAIYTALLPYYTTFRNGYTSKKSKKGIRKGDVKSQKEAFIELYDDLLPEWNRQIGAIYAPNTATYLKIFPEGRYPRGHGAMEERLIYLASIIETMGNFSLLEDIAAEMLTAYDAIDDARDTREQSGTDVKTQIDTTKDAGEALAMEAYGALGLLIHYYRKTPDKIMEYVNLALLREHSKNDPNPPVVYNMIIAAGETKQGEFEFLLTDRMIVYNPDEAKMRCYFVKELTDPMPAAYFDMVADEVKEFPIDAYAAEDAKYFMVKNMNATLGGSLEIELTQ